jgi:hypothetical protein
MKKLLSGILLIACFACEETKCFVCTETTTVTSNSNTPGSINKRDFDACGRKDVGMYQGKLTESQTKVGSVTIYTRSFIDCKAKN